MTQSTGQLRPYSSGFRNRRIRDFQTLPYAWDTLTGVDIDHLKCSIRSELDRGPNLEGLEACLMLWASLTTGRPCVEPDRSDDDDPTKPIPLALYKLRVARITTAADWAKVPPALIRDGDQWAWWLPVEAPPDQKRERSGMRPLSNKIYLPATVLTAEMIERCLAKRQLLPTRLGTHLFTTEKNLLVRRVNEIATRRNADMGRNARNATTTLEALVRWLPAALNEMAGGDMALTAAISGSIPSMAQASSAYGAVSQERLAHHYRAAVAQTDPVPPVTVPPILSDSYIGGRFTPTDETVDALIRSLATAQIESADNIDTAHKAMTDYTVGLLAFALAHRGSSGTMPSLLDVDKRTRFYWLEDKNIQGRISRRMVWICDTALAQLRLYDDHVRALEAGPLGEEIRAVRQEGGLPLFRLKRGKVDRLSVKNAIDSALSSQKLPKNAGRHWLRAQMMGVCSTETLHAFYGHGPLDNGSWDATSTLDPALYRADLARVLDPALKAAGWIPRTVDIRQASSICT